MRFATLQLAARNLLLHKLRSFLTMLGTILGVGSVIAMLAIGEGSKREAVEQIRQLGATNIIVSSVKPGDDLDAGGEDPADQSSSQEQTSRVLEYGLTHRDVERLRIGLPTVERVLPVALVRRNAQSSGRMIKNARILGTVAAYRGVKNLNIARGRFLSDVDDRKIANVAVLGSGAAQRLFGYRDPLDQPVLLGRRAFRVIGVIQRPSHGSRSGRDDFDGDIYVPLSAARSRFGELQMIVRAGSTEFERTQISEITLTVRNEDEVTQTVGMARKLLLQTHPDGNDFEMQVPLELLQQAEREKQIWNLVLGSIAGISLLVGGIGIMNIMLATITERTREIGVRRALGAKRRDITAQFLVETVVLSTTGGIVGTVLGITVPYLVTLATGIETALSVWSVALAFGISVGVGVVFGLYPARRAALMHPIEALRHE